MYVKKKQRSSKVEGKWFLYYRILEKRTPVTCNLVVLVPLLDRDNKFEIYNVIDSQLPFYDSNLTVSLQPNYVAKYKLETSALAINPERTKYMILEADELVHCSTPLLEYCNVKNSVFPINLSKLCVVALFMKNKGTVKA